MDNHPIPQDVTGFQFRLIGDMTVKQFAYLAVGSVLGWIFFISPLFILIKLPLTILFAGGGVILAFAPVGGRPADTMLLFFLKALFSPTQYVYKKSGGTLGSTPQDDNVFVNNTQPEEKKKVEEKKDEKVHLDASPVPLATNITQPSSETPQAQQSTQPQMPDVSIPDEQSSQEQNLGEKATEVTQELQKAQQEETHQAPGTQEAEKAHEKVGELEDQLQTILRQKEDLEKQLILLQQQVNQKREQVFSPSEPVEEKKTQHVRKVDPAKSSSAGTPFTNDFPNLIAGVIKDPRGNVLPNVLIEVKDKDNNPVRAFKTNALGQFASATPVLNGVYTITFEDPAGKQRFDAVEITANGSVLPSLEVISIDAREDLRRELFGAT